MDNFAATGVLAAKLNAPQVGEIERGEANTTIDTFTKIASVLGQKLGALIVEAEKLSSGVIRKAIPTIKPEYINRNVLLPTGLTHDQLEKALNQIHIMLSQIGLDPEQGDIQYNIYRYLNCERSSLVPFERNQDPTEELLTQLFKAVLFI